MKASRFFNPMPQFMYNSVAASGYKLHFFTPGTTTYKNIYTTAAKSVTVSNPVTLNSQGQLPSDVYLDGTYDVQFAAGSDTSPPASPIWTRSNVTSLTQFIYTVASKTTNYTILETDYNAAILCDATSGNITITLPTAASVGSGFSFWIRRDDASDNTVTIDPDGSETIDGDSSLNLATDNTAFIMSDGSNWVNLYPTGAGAGSVTSITLTQPAAGLTITNSGTAITSSGTRTFALANDLAALEAMSSTGLVARTASETYAQRTLTAPAAGITVSNGDGVSGNPTLALADDLAALEALSTTGMMARTASNTYTMRTLTAGSGISINNGDGVSGNPTITATGTSVMGNTYFYAEISATAVAGTDTVITLSETLDVGSDLASNTYTVPTTGIYHFFASISFTNLNAGVDVELKITKNGGNTRGGGNIGAESPVNDYTFQIMENIILSCTAGDTIQLVASQNEGTNQNCSGGWFCGYQIA